MSKNKKTRVSLRTPADLARAIRTAPASKVRACLLSIAKEVLVDSIEDDNGKVIDSEGTLNPDKSLEGADFIQEVSLSLEAYGFWPTN